MKKKVYLYHNTGDDACGGKAYEYVGDEKPLIGTPILPDEFRELSGEKVWPFSYRTCGSCNKPLGKLRIRDIK